MPPATPRTPLMEISKMKNLTILLAATFVLSMAAVAVAGDGYACTAETQECLDHLAKKAETRGYAGLDGEYNKENHTWQVTEVVAGAPADVAGFQVGDVVYGANGMAFADFDEAAWKEFEKGQTIGAKMMFKVKRDGSWQKLAVTLDTMPDSEKAKMVGKHMMAHAQLASSGS